MYRVRRSADVVRWCTAAAVALVVAIPARAGQSHLGAHEPIRSIPIEVLQRPIALHDGIGSAHDEVSAATAQSLALYNQGMSYLHSYVWIGAARSFNEALRLDPALAMAYVGLSRAFSGLSASKQAREAAERARALATNVAPRDQVRIALRTAQLEAEEHPDDRARSVAYKASIGSALVEYPDDVELLLVRSEAEDSSGASPGMGSGEGAIAFLERAVRVAPDYFAPHHYLVHAYENVGQIDRAVAHAEIYVKLSPRVPHAHHMYGHGLRRAGRMKEAVDQFRIADELGVELSKGEGVPPEYDWNYHHNLDLLGTSYQYLGQMRAAERVLRQSFETPSLTLTQELNKREWPAFLLARGASRQALEEASKLLGHESPLGRAVGHMAAGKVHMATSRMGQAATEIDAALAQLRVAGPEAGVLAEDFRLLQGEFFVRGSQREKGRQMIREAAQKLRLVSEPDQWMQTLFNIESVATAAREAGDWTLASELADVMREHDPTYGGTEYALARAAEHRGDVAAAKRSYAEALRCWSDADRDFPPLADARRRLAALK